MQVTAMTIRQGLPDRITVEMELVEAAAIVAVFGKFNGYAYQRLRVDETEDSIWGCLVGTVFNRYWDSGYDDPIVPRIDFATINTAR